jgi:hypothetical protein
MLSQILKVMLKDDDLTPTPYSILISLEIVDLVGGMDDTKWCDKNSWFSRG